VGSTTTNSVLVMTAALTLVACARPHIMPITPPPYRAVVPAPYDATWKALIRSLARQNLPLRAVARDSGVIATDEFVSPINLYADCGQVKGDQLEGEALVSFTLFVEPDGDQTRIQVNSKMRTQAHRRGSSGRLRVDPVYQCASTDKFEANLFDVVRDLVKQ
jgi:hypothetical protein